MAEARCVSGGNVKHEVTETSVSPFVTHLDQRGAGELTPGDFVKP